MTGSDEDPADYDAAWVEIKCPDEVWEPRFWLPLDALPPAPDGGLRATLRSPKLERYE